MSLMIENFPEILAKTLKFVIIFLSFLRIDTEICLNLCKDEWNSGNLLLK